MENSGQILQRLHASGKQITVVIDLYRAGFLDHLTLPAVYLRLQKLPPGERPEDHGAIRAGGSIAWLSPESAAAFAEHHREYWLKRLEAK